MSLPIAIHRITGTLTTRAPLHVGSGGIAPPPPRLGRPNADDPEYSEECEVAAIVRDHAGLPCIPGTALKGALRQWAEGWLAEQPAAAMAAAGARIDRLFGAQRATIAEGNAGLAEFCTATFRSLGGLDFHKCVPWWDATGKTGIASHVGIDRDTGAALPGILFFEEFVPEEVSFEVTIDLPRATDDDVALLLGILRQGTSDPVHPLRFGASGSNGWGLMRWSNANVRRRLPGSGFKPVSIVAAEVPRIRPAGLLVADFTLDNAGLFVVNDASRTTTGTDRQSPLHFVPLRRADGSVWLPAASFRGCLRGHYEKLLETVAQVGSLVIDGQPFDLLNESVRRDSMERVFGSTRRVSAIGIEEFREASEANAAPTVEQVSGAIDRFTGGAAEGMLVTLQAVDRPRFKTRITIDGDRLEPLDRWLLGRTFADIERGVVSFGAHGSRGFGDMAGRCVVAPGDPWLTSPALVSPSAIPASPQVAASPTAASAGARAAPAPRPIERGQLLRQGKDGSSWTLQTDKLNKKNEPVRHPGVSRQIASPQVAALKTPSLDVEFLPGPDGKPLWIRIPGEAWTPAVNHEPGTPPAHDGRFLNPYYFLTLADRDKPGYPESLGDAPPSSHARLEGGKVSGTIRLRLTTRTPLVLCESKPQPGEPGAHPTFAVPVAAGSAGGSAAPVPVLRASQVRGMLRAAFEAVTNSRFGVFAGHDRRLGLRMAAGDSLDLVPCRVEADAVRLLSGAAPTTGRKPQQAAWVPIKLLKALPTLQHKTEVQAWVQLFEKKGDRSFRYWKILAIANAGQANLKRPYSAIGHGYHHPVANEPLCYVRHGYLCINGWNFDKKHDERVFFEGFDRAMPAGRTVTIDEQVKRRWQELIFDYRQNEDLLRGLQGPGALRGAGWSRHMTVPPRDEIKTPSDVRLDVGTLGYAKIDAKGNVTDIYPVMISRKLHSETPLDRLPRSVRPAEHREQLSPADRVFGWVSQKKREKDSPAEVRAHRSLVRVRRVCCKTNDAIDPTSVTLAILGQPKPSLGRFYLGAADGKAQAAGSKDATGYASPRRIRGPKIYPHHAAGVVSAEATTTEQSKQNRTVLGTVKPGVVFECDIDVCNLAREEIGAVLWLLSLPEDHFLRLGYGKPLGFGSVRAEVIAEETHLADGAEWAKAIATGSLPDSDAHAWDWRSDFENAARSANPDMLRSFLVAARGFPGYSVHYPRCGHQAPGASEHFKWFKANDAVVNQHSLPDLQSPDPSLPILP